MAVADTLVSLGVIVSFYTLLALGMNIKYGFTGLLDFGHVAFFLIGAYTAALFVLPPDTAGDFTQYLFGLNMPWVVAAVVATLLAGVIGAFVALPTLRLREDYLAITVLGVSVILQRIVQAEAWLVNGPDSLRGIDQPLPEFFPLAGGTVFGAIGLFLIGGAIWALAAHSLGRVVKPTEAGRTSDQTVASRLYTVATLGFDRYLRERYSDNPGYDSRLLDAIGTIGGDQYAGAAIMAAVVVGVAGGVVTLFTTVGLLVFGTVVSVFTWLVLLVSVNRFAADFEPVDYAATLALGTAYMLAFAPMFLIDATVPGVSLTLLAFAIVLGATVYLRTNWSRFAARPFRYGAVAGLWFGFVWYVPLQILNFLQDGAIVAAATRVFNNVVWMLSFSGTEPVIGYSRFLLFLFGAVTIGALFVTELLVDSPFGRTLRAVRNDEDVVNSLGKDPFMFKVLSMAIGSALAGLAGALAAIYYQTLVFTMFAPRVTFIALLMMFLGGVGNNRAMVVGAAIFWAFQTATTQLSGFVEPALRTRIQAFRFVIMGVLFLAILYYRPEGLMGERAAAEVGDE
jgi:ABC-type branched-subunit amino acid transport system permease subunit